jgi:DNA-cytosine methyltransferase
MKVLTHENRWMPVIQTMSKVAPTVKIKGRGYSSMVTTKEHPFYSRRLTEKWSRANGKRIKTTSFTSPSWVDASNMVGHHWASPSNIPVLETPDFEIYKYEKDPCEMSPEFFWFVGAWLGDGWIRRLKRYGRNTERTNDQVYLCAAYTQADEVEQRIISAGLTYTKSNDRTTVRFIVSSKVLARWISKHFGERAGGKTVPAWAMGLEKDKRESLLFGYLFADGHDYGNHYKASTISKSLAHGIKLLAQCCGFTTALGCYTTKPQAVIEGRTVNQQDQWQVCIYRNQKTQTRIGDHIWGRVRDVQETFETERVYNIGVYADESYVADGLVVHNCQDVSIAGNRKGLVGERSGLWYEYRRILAEMQPRYCIIENVVGLLSSNSGRDFAVILHGLAECGYSVAWRCLDLRYFGVPQRRNRVFVVGSLGNGASAQILFERESGGGDSTAGGKAREGTTDGAEGRVVGTLTASGAGTTRPAGQMNELDMLVYDGQQITSPTHRGQGSSISPTLGSSNAGNMLISQAVDVRNLALTDEISGTLQAKKTGGYSLNYQNPVLRGGQVRRLTPLEAERLMGFPDGWTAGQSDSRRYHQLGNAVGVPVARWIASRILTVEEVRNS